MRVPEISQLAQQPTSYQPKTTAAGLVEISTDLPAATVAGSSYGTSLSTGGVSTSTVAASTVTSSPFTVYSATPTPLTTTTDYTLQTLTPAVTQSGEAIGRLTALQLDETRRKIMKFMKN
ncbi:unnamed protein product, partial [Mesorhabditis spiculigera]